MAWLQRWQASSRIDMIVANDVTGISGTKGWATLLPHPPCPRRPSRLEPRGTHGPCVLFGAAPSGPGRASLAFAAWHPQCLRKVYRPSGLFDALCGTCAPLYPRPSYGCCDRAARKAAARPTTGSAKFLWLRTAQELRAAPAAAITNDVSGIPWTDGRIILLPRPPGPCRSSLLDPRGSTEPASLPAPLPRFSRFSGRAPLAYDPPVPFPLRFVPHGCRSSW